MSNGARVLSIDVMTERLIADALRPTDVVAGSPQVASAELDDSTAAAVGVWEMTPGSVTDTEVDEIFLVLAGAGEVGFDDGSSVTLAPGVLVRLLAGDRTTWTISETIRKLYVALPGAS
jgi:hypothetical protein